MIGISGTTFKYEFVTTVWKLTAASILKSNLVVFDTTYKWSRNSDKTELWHILSHSKMFTELMITKIAYVLL